MEESKEQGSREQSSQEQLRQRHLQILDECLQDAKMLAIKHSVNSDENQVRLAIALFQKRV
ncbi:hypothetical protein HYX14_06660 [Candidatus Woesearchaeota archaeon]|nr:hypothetical protein [Candidatus Woesearchaeota archaeon]